MWDKSTTCPVKRWWNVLPRRMYWACGRWLADRTSLPLVEEIGYPTPGSRGEWAAGEGISIVTWEMAPVSIETMYQTQLPTVIEILNGGAPD